MKNHILIRVAITGLLLAASAKAQTFEYSVNNPAQNAAAGNVTKITTSFDSVAETLTWTSTFSSNSGAIPNSFWLVLNDGPNPKSIKDELAIFYFDARGSFTSGNSNGTSPLLSAYAYNGANNFNSYVDPGVGLLTSAGADWNASNVVSATGNANNRTFSFTIDTSLLNDSTYVGGKFAGEGQPFNPANWTGAAFDEKLGFWFHPTVLSSSATYDANGYLTSFPVGKQGWVDTQDLTTNKVPEPAGFLFGLLGLSFLMRRRR